MSLIKFSTVGRVLWVSKDVIYKSIGRNLYYSKDNGLNWFLRAKLPLSSFYTLCMFSTVLSRFIRAGFHHLYVLKNKSILIFANKSIYLLEKNCSSFKLASPIRSPKPLCISVHENTIIYGEYSRNKNRNLVSVYRSQDGGVSWSVIHKFEGVRHVHGVFYDKFSKKYWITTGDTDKESSIWIADKDFLNLKKILTGDQKFRAIQLLFDPHFIYYGSDSPHRENHIYRLSRKTKKLDSLKNVGAPVYFGSTFLDHFFFSTAIEKSKHKIIKSAKIWHSKDGTKWKDIVHLGRSFLPLRIFQNGQIIFPAGPGDNKNLWFWSLATLGDNQSYYIKYDDLD